MKIECDLGAHPDELVGDPERLEQVFVNLLANAAAFSPEGGSVRIATELAELDAGEVVQIAVVDQGPGVARRGRRAHLRAVRAGARSLGRRLRRGGPRARDLPAHRLGARRPIEAVPGARLRAASVSRFRP